jgi:hypothetical protein
VPRHTTVPTGYGALASRHVPTTDGPVTHR